MKTIESQIERLNKTKISRMRTIENKIERLAKAKEALEAGGTAREIADRLNVSQQWVRMLAAQYSFVLTRRNSIENWRKVLSDAPPTQIAALRLGVPIGSVHSILKAHKELLCTKQKDKVKAWYKQEFRLLISLLRKWEGEYGICIVCEMLPHKADCEIGKELSRWIAL